jgi:hypothetical protein
MDEDTVNLLEDLYSKLSDYAYAKEFDDGVFKSAAENVICEYMRIDNISQAASSLLKGVLRSINTVTQKAEVLYQEWIAQQSSTESTDSTDNAQE